MNWKTMGTTDGRREKYPNNISSKSIFKNRVTGYVKALLDGMHLQNRRRFMEEKAAERYAERHKATLEYWYEGEIQKVWTDGDGNICIAYESGKWWHYRETGNGDIEWW